MYLFWAYIDVILTSCGLCSCGASDFGMSTDHSRNSNKADSKKNSVDNHLSTLSIFIFVICLSYCFFVVSMSEVYLPVPHRFVTGITNSDRRWSALEFPAWSHYYNNELLSLHGWHRVFCCVYTVLVGGFGSPGSAGREAAYGKMLQWDQWGKLSEQP